MASFDYRLNPLYPIKECSSCGLYTIDYCCSEGSLGDKIICDLNKTPNFFQEPSQSCPKCGNPVDGHYCQGCALLRNKFKKDLFTYYIENGILQDSSEPSNDNTNNVNALQEPFVINQDLGKNCSQSPPQINHHCCYACGDSLEDIFCHQCTCELCGKGAHYGYNYSPKVPNGNSFTYDSTSNLVHDSPNIFNPPSQPPLYTFEFYGNDARYGHYCTPQEEEKQIEEEQAAKARYWKIPICYDDDDDEDYAIAVTPILSTEEPDNSLSMGDEHLDTVPATESDEFKKSSVENLDQFKDFSDFNDNSTLIDDYSFSIDNIEYVEASPPDSDLVSIEETNTFDNSLPESETFCFDLEEISSGSTTTRFDISLPDYEVFYNDHVKGISSGSTTTHSDSSLYDSFIFDLSINPFPPADRSDFYEFTDEFAHIISPPEYDCFCFKNKPNSGDFTILSIRESSRRIKNDSVKLEVKAKQGLFGNPNSSYVQFVSFSPVKDIKEKNKIRAKTGQNQEQTERVEKSKVKPDKGNMTKDSRDRIVLIEGQSK
uniref:Pre-mRNA splicing Prp18-interacting factor n=1 Tax=Tanacetum cinerariifolium TaxID=118510 RepID=A0A699GP67_TANCI|nr:hypothetical protein [Tanacetum cinerariifolium]